MSDTILRTPMTMVKVPVSSARGMLLTETFKLAGRAAMIVEPISSQGEAAGRPGARDLGSEGRSHARTAGT